MTQWCRFLPEFGWSPTVLCRYYGSEATPDLIAAHLHPDVRVQYLDKPEIVRPRVSGQRMRALRKAKTLIADGQLGRMLVPHASLSFWRSVRPKVLAAFEQHRPDAILTTGPPHSNHDIGMWLTGETGVPWIADFRDPYIIDRRYGPFGALGHLRAGSHQAYERAIYERAALVIHAIPLHARWARRKYSFARDRIKILPNGCPRELCADGLAPLVAEEGRKSLRVVGRIGANEAFQIVAAVRELTNDDIDVELRIVGAQPANGSLLAQTLGERFITTGPVRHDEALLHLLGADVLISSASPERAKTLGLSSKLFEYLAVGKPVIVVNPTIPDRQLLGGISGVQILTRPDVPDLAAAIRSALESSARPSSAQVAAWRARYDRRAQTGVLADWLQVLTSSAKTGLIDADRVIPIDDRAGGR